jgi:hypothetical protein
LAQQVLDSGEAPDEPGKDISDEEARDLITGAISRELSQALGIQKRR